MNEPEIPGKLCESRDKDLSWLEIDTQSSSQKAIALRFPTNFLGGLKNPVVYLKRFFFFKKKKETLTATTETLGLFLHSPNVF